MEFVSSDTEIKSALRSKNVIWTVLLRIIKTNQKLFKDFTAELSDQQARQN
jgi:hypothetical protein